MGDFNCHSETWGSNRRDARGVIVEDLIDELNLVVLNDGSATHFSSAYQSFSAIDLTLVSPSIASLMKYKVLEDLHHSDHFPIQCELINTPRQQRNTRKKWKQDLADWTNFRDEIALSEQCEDSPINVLVEHVTRELINAANQHIPSSTSKPPKCVPWWSREIKEAIAARRSALSNFKRYPTTSNFIEFKKLRARARRLIQTSKKSSWEAFLGQINPHTSSICGIVFEE